MKRIVIVLSAFVALMFMLTFTGYGSSKNVVLNFYYWDENQKPAMDQIIKDFEKKNPGIAIKSTVIPWDQYWMKIQTSLPTSSGPDILWLNGINAPKYMSVGLILNLQKYIDKEKTDLSNFPDSLKKIYSLNGKLYAIPKDYDTIALLYNKQCFDEAKVPYPTDDWTWDDLLAAAQKLTLKNEDGSVKQWGYYCLPTIQGGVADAIYQNAGQIYNKDLTKAVINSPENVETVQFLVDLMYKYKVSPNGAQQKDIDYLKAFSSGQVAMYNDGSWMINDYSKVLGDKLGVAALPYRKQRATIIHGLGFAASAKTKYPNQAWKFLKFLATKEAGLYQAKAVIPAYKGAETQWIQNFPAVSNVKVFIDETKYAFPLPVSSKNSAAVWSALDNELQNIWLKTKDVATGLADAQKAMNNEMNK